MEYNLELESYETGKEILEMEQQNQISQIEDHSEEMDNDDVAKSAFEFFIGNEHLKVPLNYPSYMTISYYKILETIFIFSIECRYTPLRLIIWSEQLDQEMVEAAKTHYLDK